MQQDRSQILVASGSGGNELLIPAEHEQHYGTACFFFPSRLLSDLG